MKNILLIVCCCLLGWGVSAQNTRVISGTVVDQADQLPLPGAYIMIAQNQAAATGAVTDIEGHFRLTVPATTKAIEVTLMGYETKTVTLTVEADYVISMTVAQNQLEEVVVTGYQAIEKRKLTSAVEQIDMADIKQEGVASVDQMLTGQVAGGSGNHCYWLTRGSR